MILSSYWRSTQAIISVHVLRYVLGAHASQSHPCGESLEIQSASLVRIAASAHAMHMQLD